MGTAERRAREKDELRRKIQDVATEMFLKHGYESVSMRKIAQKIEYAPSTIYLYFKDKVDLVGSICVEAFAELDDRLQKILELGLPPLETLRRSMRAYIEFGLENPRLYLFVFCTPLDFFQQLEKENDKIVGCGMGSFDRLRQGLKVCMEAGEIRSADVESAAQTTWLATHGVTAGIVSNPGFPFIDQTQLLEDFLDRLVRGLK